MYNNNLTFYDKYEIDKPILLADGTPSGETRKYLVAEMTAVIRTNKQFSINVNVPEEQEYINNKTVIDTKIQTFINYAINQANANGFSIQASQ